VARPLLPFAALAAAVAIMAVALAPASIADGRLAQLTHGGLRLSDTEGTVWNARGVLVAGATQIPVAWRIDAWPLLRGELRVHLASEAAPNDGAPRADIVLRGGTLELRDVNLTLPAALLNAAAGPAAGWAIGGEINLSAATLEWAPPANRGSARVVWRSARLLPPGRAAPLELGDVSLALGAEGDRVFGPVSNAGGDLAIRGDVTARAATGIELGLVLSPRRADDRDLAQALSMLGPRDGDGWRVDWRLPLR
jgi:general secretion pathway protein N